MLTRPNKVETAVHGCNCWLSVWTLSCRCPGPLSFSRSISLALFVILNMFDSVESWEVWDRKFFCWYHPTIKPRTFDRQTLRTLRKCFSLVILSAFKRRRRSYPSFGLRMRIYVLISGVSAGGGFSIQFLRRPTGDMLRF